MAEAAARNVLDKIKISQGHLECPICCCRFDDPKMLDCTHNFCLKCLGEIRVVRKQKAEKITCPVCRRETDVPDEGLQSLTSSFVLISLVNEVRHQEKELREELTPTTVCDCGEDQEVAWRCLDCSDNLCQKCHIAHERLKYTKHHKIISLEDWHMSKITPAEQSKPIAQMCTNHSDHVLCFYCDSCDTVICSMCAALDHRSAEHSYKNIDESARSFRNEVNAILPEFEKCKQHFKSTENSLELARNRLQKKLAQARCDISAQAEAGIAQIRNKAKLLTEEVDKIGQEREGEFQKALKHNRDQMERADQIVTDVNNLMRQADGVKILELKPKVMHNLAFQKELKCEPAKLDTAFVAVKCQDVVSATDLGEVLLKENWQLKDEFGKEDTDDGEFKLARCVACFKNGDIVVIDTEQNRLSLFSCNGQYKTSVDHGAGCHELKAPFSAAVNCNDLLFVIDGEEVKVFDNELQFVRVFTPTPDDSEGLPEGRLTAIDVVEQRVALADRGRHVISVYNLDGSLIASISKNMVDTDLAMSNNERLIFTNFDENRLLCIDFKGDEVFNVTTLINGKQASPFGVLYDDDGSFYVAVHSGILGDGKVQHYDSNGAFIATVTQGLYYPLCMAFSPAGDVVVADCDSIKIFKRM